MASTPNEGPALLSAPTDVSTAVDANIALVQAALNAGLNSVQGRFLGGEEADHAAAVLMAMQGPLDAWAKRGRDAANAHSVPDGPNGWAGWNGAGAVFLGGIKDITQLGTSGVLRDIVDTGADSAKATVKAIQAVAHKAYTKAHKVVSDALDDHVRAPLHAAVKEKTHQLLNTVGVVAGLALVYFFVVKKGRK